VKAGTDWTLIEQYFDVLDLPCSGPVHLAVAFPNAAYLKEELFPRSVLSESGRVISGRGLTSDEAYTSCLGEAAELLSCCEWGDELLIRAPATKLGSMALLPEKLLGLSDSQYAEREAWNAVRSGFDWRPRSYSSAQAIAWIALHNATSDQICFAPADFLLIGRNSLGNDSSVAIGDSNGCAAGSTIEDARLAALLEIIERDAAARWWYGRRHRPAVDLASLNGNGFVEWLRTRKRRSFLFDITSDLGVPVAAAASSEVDGSDVVLGFAARPNWNDASSAALTEMVQIEFSLNAARVLGNAANNWAKWLSSVTMATPPLDSAFMSGRICSHHSISPSVESLLQICSRAGIQICFADMTRDRIGIPTFRAISLDLCHIKPRFANKRLLASDHNDLHPVSANPDHQVPLLI
jgi:ribosomal protein S12 methylthiotransferase accessory factor